MKSSDQAAAYVAQFQYNGLTPMASLFHTNQVMPRFQGLIELQKCAVAMSCIDSVRA